MFNISARNSFRFSSTFLVAAILISVPYLHASETARIKGELGGLPTLPEHERAAATINICKEIAALPAGKDKVGFADQAAHVAPTGDQDHDALQAVADTLSNTLKESPVPAKGDMPPMPYMDLAKLARYEGATVSLNDPLYQKAVETLVANEADISKADFTLKDLNHNPWTLSKLRGKIVLVNFWATDCMPCHAEMPVLDAIYTRYQNQGLVVLSITKESALTVVPALTGKDYHPPVLTDTNEAVDKQFHVVAPPETFVFDRNGTLVGMAPFQSTQKQFFALLGLAGLKPE